MRSSTNTRDTNNNAKKAEEISKMIETVRKVGSNKQCFDCGEKVKKLIKISGNYLCCREFRNLCMYKMFRNT